MMNPEIRDAISIWQFDRAFVQISMGIECLSSYEV